METTCYRLCWASCLTTRQLFWNFCKATNDQFCGESTTQIMGSGVVLQQCCIRVMFLGSPLHAINVSFKYITGERWTQFLVTQSVTLPLNDKLLRKFYLIIHTGDRAPRLYGNSSFDTGWSGHISEVLPVLLHRWGKAIQEAYWNTNQNQTTDPWVKGAM